MDLKSIGSLLYSTVAFSKQETIAVLDVVEFGNRNFFEQNNSNSSFGSRNISPSLFCGWKNCLLFGTIRSGCGLPKC